MKKLKVLGEYLAAFLIISILLFTIASTVIVKFYGDEVQEYAMEFVNEQIDTKIAIEEIGISLFRKFPNTSVFLNNVSVWSGHQINRNEFSGINTDTLLVAERVYVQFNLLDLARKKFNIKGFEIQNGICNVLIDSKGNTNFSIIREKKERDDKNPFQLGGVQFKKVHICYINKAKDIQGGLKVEQVYFEGAFEKDAFDMKTKGSFYIDSIISNKISYISGESLESDISLRVENKHYSISKGSLMLGEIESEISGEFLIDKENGTDLNLQIQGHRIDLDLLSEILEKQGINYGIKGNGNVDLKANINGILATKLNPHIEAEITGSNASIRSDKLPFDIRNLSFKASYNNGPNNRASSSSVSIEKLNAKIGNSVLDFTFFLKDFKHPQIGTSIMGSIDCMDLTRFVPELPLEIHSGIIKPDCRFKGSIGGLRGGQVKIQVRGNGQINYSGISFTSLAFNLPIQNFEGSIEFTDKSCSISSDFLLGESCMKLSLESSNIISGLIDKTDYHISGDVYASRLNIDELMNNFPKKNDSQNMSLKFPKNISADIDFGFDHIIFGDLDTKHINGNFRYSFPGLYINPFYLETLDGRMNARLNLFDLNKEKHQVSLSSELDNINITHLFSSFNNFRQSYLTDKNIAGDISGNINFLSTLDKQFKPLTEDIISESNITIRNGELNDFEPMNEMAKFLKINELNNIQFSTISNTIQVKDNSISIPQMDIISNAFSLNAMGTHSFEKTFDYHLAIKLSDLLFNKAKSSKKKEFEVALDEEDRRSLFLWIYDDGDGIMIDFDEEQAMKKIRSDIKEEKTELKAILNEEFGIFKNDEKVKEQQKKTGNPKFGFEFPDETIADTIQKKEKKKRWWQKEKEENKKPDFEFVIDSSDI